MATLALPPLSTILKRVLLEDWSLKFISLFLALLMWIYIDGELTDVRQVAVTLRPADLSLPEGWDVAPGRPMPRVFVQLRGPRRRLALVNGDMIRVQQKIQVDHPVSGRNVLRIPLDAMVAQGFDIVGIFPMYESDITVELAQIVSAPGKPQTMRVKLPVRPLPPPGAAMRVEPEELEVEIAMTANTDTSADITKTVVLVAEWPAQWGVDEASGGTLQPMAVPVRILAPSQYAVTGVDGTALPTVQARGLWVPALVKQPVEKQK